jgi:transcription initiation factor TFIIIB Brf1 subunit/transcription initiation factor TFIIB
MKLKDYALKCCGIVVSENIYVSEYEWRTIEGKEQKQYYVFTDEEIEQKWDKLFQLIEEHQYKYRRNCAMISVVKTGKASKQADKRGWTKVFEFFNPNTSNTVEIYTKLLWKNRDEHNIAYANGYRPDSSKNWAAYEAPEVEHAM